jgi:hypothetical protein
MRLIVCLLGLLTVSLSALTSAEPASAMSQNAALRYWHAFDAMGKLEPRPEDYLDPETWKPLDDAARKLLDEHKTSLLYLRRGASMPACDWGLHLEDGPGLLLPQLQKSRDLARLGCLSMRRNFEEGRPAEAVEDLMASLTLARHLSSDRTMIAMLVQFAIETTAHHAAAPYLTHLDAKGLQALSARLEKLPPSATLRLSIDLENEAMIGWLIQRINEKMPPETVEKIMGGEGSYTKLFKSLGAQGCVKELENLRKDYEELSKALALPRAQQDAKVDEARKKMEANVFGKLLVPAVNKVRAAEDRMEVRRAMFRAALVLAQDGPEAARKIKDPAGDGPFTIEKLESGYELRSKLMDTEKRVPLRVGTAKK